MVTTRSSRAGAARLVATLLLGIGALLAGGCGSSSSSSTATKPAASPTTPAANPTKPAKSGPNGSTGPEGMPLQNGPALAPASTTAPGVTVDGIQCAPIEQLAYHIHAHLQVFVNGQPRSIPGGIGMLGAIAEPTADGPFYGATQCYYWLHTHAYDGVVHIESPTLKIYTLGQFFDEWGQPLSSDQVAGAKGRVTAYFNGRPWTKSPRAVPLVPHAAIQLDVGSPPVPFVPVSWAGTHL